VDVISLEFTYYRLAWLVVGLIVSLVAIRRLPEPVSPARVIEALLAWFVFFNIGVSYLSNFIEYAFFGAASAQLMGWPDSPFQFEVAAASLGFAAVGFAAAFRILEMRLLAILGPTVFVLGDVYAHVRPHLTTYTDVVILMIGFILLWMQLRLGQPWTQDRRKRPYLR
jgi:hypothetical protein